MPFSSWLVSLTPRLSAATRRRRQNASRRSPLEALECRALLSGDTLATATVVNLQDDQPDQFTDEIGNEGHGNLDVDLYQVSLTQGTTLVLGGTEVSPRDQIQAVVNQLTSLINRTSNPVKLVKAFDHAVNAVTALDNMPHVDDPFDELKDAFKELEDTIHETQSAVKNGELGADTAGRLANSLVGAARNMAQNLHDYAESVGGEAKKLESSQEHLQKADAYRDSGTLNIGNYENAIHNLNKSSKDANDAARKVDQAAPLQALNSLILTFRLFDSSGNEIAEVHGRGGITLTWSVTSSDTYYIGISGNDNFGYEPAEAESGEEGSTGCYGFEFEVDEPPRILIAQAVLIDPATDLWEISGVIEDEFPEGVTVNFGGILAGHSVLADEFGAFTFSIVLDKNLPNTEGLVIATAVDGMGQSSTPYEFSVDQYC